VLAQGERKGFFFAFATDEFEVLDFVTVANDLHALLDNRTLIEFVSHVVRGGPDHLYATNVGILIGFCADERGGGTSDGH